ncbi:glycosyltransferase [bacterium]|nr:glycosyltransferase [bacterium]
MMRVTLDTNGLFTTQAGVARYIRGLLSGLCKGCDDSIRVRQLAWEVENFTYQQPQRTLKTIYRDFVWRPWVGPRALRRQPADVFHSTVGAYVIPPESLGWVATLHDLATFRFPSRFRRWHRFSSKRQTVTAMRADKVICISRFTADEAMKILGASARKIEIVYNGCDFHPDAIATSEKTPDFPVPSEFFLFVGSIEPGKNLRLLRNVYELAAGRGINLPPLVIVGSRWVGVAGEGPPPHNWHYMGRQPDEVLVWLYRRALALAFPSVYEGFGLPVVEAMSLGCPVICGPVASLPEVGGDAPVYVELEPVQWLEILRLLASDNVRRRECVSAGLEQSLRFSWTRCAKETKAVYRLVCGGNVPHRSRLTR